MSRKMELSAVYARLIMQSGVATPAELLHGIDFTTEKLQATEYLDADDIVVIFRNYHRCVGDRTWTARLGSQFSLAAHGPLGFAALSAPTLGESLDVISALYGTRNTAMHVSTYATANHYMLTLEDLTGAADVGAWLTEVVLKITEELISAIIGHPVGKNVVISFAHPAPDDAALLEAAYAARVQFDAAHNSIAIPLAWRQLPSPLRDDAVYRANVIKCRELIAAREQAGSIARTVENLLRNHFDTQMLGDSAPHPPPTLEQVAGQIHLTTRTLIRKLQREDASYKDLLEDLRREYAEHLLQDARLKVADVAETLGYREPANFGRAFRRWYGVSPAAWRRR